MTACIEGAPVPPEDRHATVQYPTSPENEVLVEVQFVSLQR